MIRVAPQKKEKIFVAKKNFFPNFKILFSNAL